MTGFELSPGITPALTDIFVVGVPLLIGLGYLLAGRRGFEFAFGASAVVLGAVKLYTDYTDPFDVVVALAALLGGGFWLRYAGLGRGWTGRAVSTTAWVGGLGCVVVGLLKLRDFYDPFDILLADAAVVAGAALFLYGRRIELPMSGSP